jgi:hypothetical protein
MNRKRTYIFSLVVSFVLWGVFGFAGTASGGAPVVQASPGAMGPTRVEVEGTRPAEIPITGEPEPVWTEIVVFYSLIGITASFLIFALLQLVNKSAVQYVENHKTRSSDKTHQN